MYQRKQFIIWKNSGAELYVYTVCVCVCACVHECVYSVCIYLCVHACVCIFFFFFFFSFSVTHLRLHYTNYADKLRRNFWDGTFFLLITVAEPLEANTESSSEEVSYAHFFDSDIFSQLKEFWLRSEPMFEPKPASLLQDLMRAYHKRAHIPFEHGGHVKNRIASKKRTESHLSLSRSWNKVVCVVCVMQA